MRAGVGGVGIFFLGPTRAAAAGGLHYPAFDNGRFVHTGNARPNPATRHDRAGRNDTKFDDHANHREALRYNGIRNSTTALTNSHIMRMNNMKQQMLAALFGAAALLSAHGQGFDNGSNGSLGSLTVVDSDVTVDLPPDGRLHYTTVSIAQGRTLRFNRNPLNTAVYLLAQ